MQRLLIALLLFAGPAFAQEDKLIAILKSDAPFNEKADACRELARGGTPQAVPVLAALLPDDKLSHLARHALEPIADLSVDAALRDALGKLKGRLLLGVIGSVGVRKDPQAIAPLAQLLHDADPAVAQGAARALGSIGGAAVPVLEKALATGSPDSQLAVCEGLFRGAEALSGTDAAAIYDTVRRLPNMPHQIRVAAVAGAIRSRGANGVPLLVEAIRTESDVPAADAIRISMDLPGAEVTKALAGELALADPKKQLLLVQTLGNRGDVTAAAALVPMAQNGAVPRRIAAIRSLVQLGTPASLPVLVALMKDPEAAVASAAQTGLVGFPGKEADSTIVELLKEPDARTRTMAIEVVAQRRILSVVPVLLATAGDADASVASASFKALGELGSVAEIPGLVKALLQTKAWDAAENALTAICERQADPAFCTDQLLPGLARAKGEAKLALLRILGGLGDRQALDAVRAAATEADEAVKETARQALCDWPTTDALPDLALLTRTTADKKLKLSALRGQFRLIPLQTGTEAQKVSQLKELLPLSEQLNEQRLALATLGQIHSAESLELVVPYLTREGFKEEASVAAVAIADKLITSHPAEVAEAMKQVETRNSQLAARARKLLARVPTGATEAGFTSIFNGKDLTGWDSKPGWWTVEDGALTAESTPEKVCKECNYLIWRGGQPADFELRADFKLSQGANSGIQIRSEERPDWDTSGYQADMTGDGNLVGFVYHHQRGLIAGRGEKAVFAADGKKTVEQIGDPKELLTHFKQGDWSTYRVVCRGSDITLYVNGTLMCQITDHHATQAATRGIIALQMHPGPPMKIQFRNILLKELK